MSYPPPPGQPGSEHRYTSPSWPPPRSRPRSWLWVGAVALALAAGGAAVLISNGPEPSRAEQAASTLPGPDATPALATTTTPPSPIATPLLVAIKLTPEITEQKCFGSAGCIVEFDVDMKWIGIDQPPTGTVWRVTYEVTGIEDAPAIGSFTFNDKGYNEASERVQTTGPKAEIRIAVTRIELESS